MGRGQWRVCEGLGRDRGRAVACTKALKNGGAVGWGGGGGLEIGVYDRGLFCALTEQRLCPAWLWNAAVLTDRRPLCGPSCHHRVSSRRAAGAGRVRRHTSDMRDGHSSRRGGGDKMRPHSHSHSDRHRGGRGADSDSKRSAASLHGLQKKKKKKKKEKIGFPRWLDSWRAPHRGQDARVCVRLPVGG